MGSQHDINIRYVNASYARIDCADSIRYELSDHYTFDIPGAQYMPGGRFNKRSRGHWDGKIRLYSKRDSLLPRGLLEDIQQGFARSKNYTTSEDERSSEYSRRREVSGDSIRDFIEKLDIRGADGSRINCREDQLDAIEHGLRERRALILSPTASGKTLIGYVIFQYLRNQSIQDDVGDGGQSTRSKHVRSSSGFRGLVLVPRIQLVNQLIDDWCQFSAALSVRNDPRAVIREDFHAIYGGMEGLDPNGDANSGTQRPRIVVSTWQSLFKLSPSVFDQFTVVLGDEAHEFKAKSLSHIMNSCVNAHDRIGLTGTLDGTNTHKLVLEGLFGPARKIISSRELMDKGHIAKLRPIKIMLLKHHDHDCKALKKKQEGYEGEITHLISSDVRNKFVSRLALRLEGNTLVLFQRVETHGKLLYEMMRAMEPNRKVFFIHGGIDTDIRENVRQIVERETDAIIVASYGTFSTGINIRNLHNVVFASPSKSRIRNRQSIGRGLRIGDANSEAPLFAIADNLRPASKGSPNFTYNHLIERMKVYVEEKFPYKIYDIQLPLNSTAASLTETEAFQND